MKTFKNTRKIMSIAAVVGLVALIALLYVSSVHEGGTKPKSVASELRLRSVPERTTPPHLGWVDTNNNMMNLKQLSGRVVYFNVWAPWCKPCLEEIPQLHKLALAMSNCPFSLVHINTDENNHNFREQIAIEKIPLHLILDKHGKIAVSYFGSVLDNMAQIKAWLQVLCAEP